VIYIGPQDSREVLDEAIRFGERIYAPAYIVPTRHSAKRASTAITFA